MQAFINTLLLFEYETLLVKQLQTDILIGLVLIYAKYHSNEFLASSLPGITVTHYLNVLEELDE
jgi:hypothetical protein